MPHVRGSLIATLALFAAGAVPAGAVTPPAGPAAESGDLSWRGDIASARAFMDDIAEQYAKAGRGHIRVEAFSTLSGLDAVADGSADLAGIARPKHDRRTQEQAIDFVPVALGAVVLITHPRNPVDNLDLAQIRDIYLGRITNWSALGGEDKPINLYAIAAPYDGVEYSLRTLVFRNGRQPVAAPRLYLNTAKLEEAVAIDPTGLGVSTLSATWDNKAVKRLRVEGVAASSATVADASYPLSSALYLAYRGDSPKLGAIDRFLAFLAEPAAKDTLRRHQLMPYSEVDDVIARLAAQRAFIDSRLDVVPRAATAVAAAPPPTPVSAPRATLESRVRIAPSAASTEAARANLARAEKAEAAHSKATSSKATSAAEAKLAGTPPAKAATKAKAKEPAPRKAVAKASFGNVEAQVRTGPAAKASFGNVDAGADTQAPRTSGD
jgi:phosphate transport system substrate-binding protein